ncbi:hypothetical protein [Bacillus sp. BP-3]|uniref:hypothetical protein n=1 Tax=Bacillus sp. BP-3 TaxID=3022773 RepID=UPI00232AC501|nr:hypothetical protein [Bacillus sp. BP-3]MDC2864387.1 hypothetical protein [Bacillus sp. BP-3]
MKRSLICLALPVLLVTGGCSNSDSKKEDKIEVAEKEEISYTDQVKEFTGDFYEGTKKLAELTTKDSSLFTVKEEQEKVHDKRRYKILTLKIMEE